MKIEIWSDVMCPFCYIGKHNFENALQKLPFKYEVEVEWKSFQLDPTLDASKAMNTIEYFKEKKGASEEQAKQMMGQVVQMGKNSGIDFNFEKTLITNTFQAHKILHLAKKYNTSSEMEEALFRSHFLNGENIADTEILISLAESLGINKEEATQVLTSDKYDHEVNDDIQDAKKHQITAVPFFILNGKYAVSGAQPIELFENALTQTYEETVSPLKNLSNGKNSCDTNECSI